MGVERNKRRSAVTKGVLLKSRSALRKAVAAEDIDSAGKTSLVNAVSRAFAILEAFETSIGSLGNQEIAEICGLPKSTVSRITNTLTELRYLTFSEETEKYRLGARVVSLAKAFHRGNSIATVIQPHLQELAARTRSTVGLGVRDGMRAVYLQVARGVSHIILHVEIGSHLPLSSSALGLALVHADDREKHAETLREIQDNDPSEWPLVQRRIQIARRELEEHGYCVSIGTWNEDINGVAAPIGAPDQPHRYAINIGGPSFWMSRETLHKQHGPALREMITRLDQEGLVTGLFPGASSPARQPT